MEDVENPDFVHFIRLAADEFSSWDKAEKAPFSTRSFSPGGERLSLSPIPIKPGGSGRNSPIEVEDNLLKGMHIPETIDSNHCVGEEEEQEMFVSFTEIDAKISTPTPRENNIQLLETIFEGVFLETPPPPKNKNISRRKNEDHYWTTNDKPRQHIVVGGRRRLLELDSKIVQ